MTMNQEYLRRNDSLSYSFETMYDFMQHSSTRRLSSKRTREIEWLAAPSRKRTPRETSVQHTIHFQCLLESNTPLSDVIPRHPHLISTDRMRLCAGEREYFDKSIQEDKIIHMHFHASQAPLLLYAPASSPAFPGPSSSVHSVPCMPFRGP